MIILVVNTEIYSRFTKNIVFVDTFAIGINFVIRAVSGIILINTTISPWIVLGVFFVALFLAFLKRKSEKKNLGNSAEKHRSVLRLYRKNVLDLSVYVSGLMIIFTYITYSIIGHFLDGRLIFSIPFVIAAVLRLFQLSRNNHPLIEKNEFYKDKIVLGLLTGYSLITLILLYSETYSIFLNNVLWYFVINIRDNLKNILKLSVCFAFISFSFSVIGGVVPESEHSYVVGNPFEHNSVTIEHIFVDLLF